MYDETAQTTEAFNIGLESGKAEERKKYIEAMRTMSAKLEELEDKHWEECRQIALYDDELKQLKKEIAEKYVKREEMWAKTCRYKEDEE